MPILAGLLSNLFVSIASFLATFIGKKLAIAMTAIATLSTLTVGMYAALALLLNGISAGLPSIPGISMGFWVAAPDNLPACISAILSVDTTIALYRWSVRNVSLLAQAS